jgi:hypothetical protein
MIEIIRKLPRGQGTLIETDVLDDPSLSFKARGIYGFLCKYRTQKGPINFKAVDLDELIEASKEGWHAILSGLRELEKRGLFSWPPEKEFVYIAYSGRSGYYKIGYTRSHCVSVRIAALQTADPSICLWLKVRGSRKLEQRLHRKFAANRVHGEWFSFGEDGLDNVLSSL